MKFGGTSLADAARISAVVRIVDRAVPRGPVVVVSALAGVTDLLAGAVDLARRGDREALERAIADVDRRHRWALSGSVEDPARRHDVGLSVDVLFDDLRQLIRSVRILGEGTPRAADALLAFGEMLSSRILAAALADRGIDAVWIDPRDVMVTDARHGAAEPILDAVAERCERILRPHVEARRVPILGGFVGATADGRTTTLGRGGSDTSAAVIGSAMGAEEIQIWTDVDGLMSADPKWVASAVTLPRVSFAEAAELAFYGAKVLHPASVAPAVRRNIPVRILNSLRPDVAGTTITSDRGADAPPIASVASRGGVATLRVTSPRMRMDGGFLPRVVAALERSGIVPELVAASEVAVTFVVPQETDVSGLERDLAGEAVVERRPGCAIVCVVGSGLQSLPGVREEVLAALAGLQPELVELGGSGSSAAAVIRDERLAEGVSELHRKFFEERST